MKLNRNEQDGIIMMVVGLGADFWLFYHFVMSIASGNKEGLIVLIPVAIAAMFMAAMGVVFLMRKGPARLCASLSRLKAEAWQPVKFFS